MKKALIVLMIAVMLPISVFAARGPVDITVGAIAQYNKGLGTLIEEAKTDPKVFTDMKNYQFGGEARFRFAILEIDAGALISKNADALASAKFFNKFNYSGFANVGISLDLVFIRLGVTMGTSVNYAPDGTTWGIENPGVDPQKFWIGDMDAARLTLIKGMDGGIGQIKNQLLTAPLQIRATVDFLLGNLTVGANCTLMTPLSIATISNKDLWKQAYEGAQTKWVDAKVGVYLGINLI